MPKLPNKTPRRSIRPAWYRRYREFFLRSIAFIYNFESQHQRYSAPTLATFEKETLTRFIFESNNIEREGLPFGETQKLVLGEIDEDPKVNEMLQNQVELKQEINRLLEFSKDRLTADLVLLTMPSISKTDEETLEKTQVRLLARHGKKNKDFNIVSQHFTATLLADNQALKSSLSRMSDTLYPLIQKDLKSSKKKERERALIVHSLLFPDDKPGKFISLLDEEYIKKLHKTLAGGLIPKGETPAGEYRTHPITTGFESHYPAHQDIPKAMKHFIYEFRRLESDNLNPISLATFASTQFVLIHPFSDFNGRVSRLIMNIVLRSHNLPFWTSLRSNSKDRRRYMTGLNHYRKSTFYSLATLISMQICNHFNALNHILKLSDYPPVPDTGLPKDLMNLNLRVLYDIPWPIYPIQLFDE